MPDRSIRAPLGAQPDTRDGDRRSALDLFLESRSIAVIGASDDPTRIGGRTLFNIRQGGFPGPVYPIKPRRQTVQGDRKRVVWGKSASVSVELGFCLSLKNKIPQSTESL